MRQKIMRRKLIFSQTIFEIEKCSSRICQINTSMMFKWKTRNLHSKNLKFKIWNLNWMKFNQELSKRLILREKVIRMKNECWLKNQMIWTNSWNKKKENWLVYKLKSKIWKRQCQRNFQISMRIQKIFN